MARFCTNCGSSVAFRTPPPTIVAPPAEAPPPAQAPPPPRSPQRPPPARPPRDSRRSRLLGTIAGVILVLGGAAAAVLLTTHPFSHETVSNAASTSGSSAHRSAPATAAVATSAPATAAATAGQVTEEQAAQSLGGMLAQSAPDRTAITQAVSDVEACGPSLNSDPQVFESAASSRRTLLTQLAAMPGASALPAPMLQDLSSAWQASISADQDFAQWANDEITNGCTRSDTSDPGWVAAQGPDTDATTDKKAFVSMWNPIAAQYGLPTYAWDQL